MMSGDCLGIAQASCFAMSWPYVCRHLDHFYVLKKQHMLKYQQRVRVPQE
jgi:hypothetical protein